MGISRVFKKKSAAEEAPAMQISDPVSQNYEYGSEIPPWLNSYADLAMVQVEAVPSRARYYSEESVAPPRFAPLGHFHSTTWVAPTPTKEKDLASPWASPRSSTSSSTSSTVNITLEQPPPYEAPQTKRSGLRNRLFRNRGLNADGTLRDEYDDLGMPEWGIPDEFATPKRRGHFGW